MTYNIYPNMAGKFYLHFPYRIVLTIFDLLFVVMYCSNYRSIDDCAVATGREMHIWIIIIQHDSMYISLYRVIQRIHDKV